MNSGERYIGTFKGLWSTDGGDQCGQTIYYSFGNRSTYFSNIVLSLTSYAIMGQKSNHWCVSFSNKRCELFLIQPMPIEIKNNRAKLDNNCN